MYKERIWAFVTDMNFDGAVTISDISLWFKWLFFLPGDGLIYFIMNSAPDLARFFELSNSNYGGIFSGVFSGIVYLIGLGALTAME